jgi:hypothetical protein
MRLDRTLNQDEIREVQDACADYQNEGWEVQGVYPEWHPFQGNHEGKGSGTGKIASCRRPRVEARRKEG